MKVRLLGTAGGGGFPQWNCACSNCDRLRRGKLRSTSRREFCVAISADGDRWFLIEAPADVRTLIEFFQPLQPRDVEGSVRNSGVEGILLTGADLDQTLGLLTLREGPRMSVHSIAYVKCALAAGLRLPSVLDRYAGIDWCEPPQTLSHLRCRDGSTSGILYSAFVVGDHPPRYMTNCEEPFHCDRVAYRLVDEKSGKQLIVAPGLARLNTSLLEQLGNCDVLLLDGTFWSDDELQHTNAGTQSATEMGHLAVGGSEGSLVAVSLLRAKRKIYVHINNTNPMLDEDSVEFFEVRQAGLEIGKDGLEFEV